jgi:osmotically-inducible protein OsmY
MNRKVLFVAALAVASFTGAASYAAAPAPGMYAVGAEEVIEYRYREYPPPRYAYRVVPSDDIIHERVRTELRDALGRQMRGVTVSVVDGIVYLSGTVRTDADRLEARDVALATEGVRRVNLDRLYAEFY